MTEELKQKLIQTCNNPQKESCGLILSDDSLIHITNVSANPDHFIFDRAEYFTALKTIKDSGLAIRAIFHSHRTGDVTPSRADLEAQQGNKQDMVIVSGTKINWIPYAENCNC